MEDQSGGELSTPEPSDKSNAEPEPESEPTGAIYPISVLFLRALHNIHVVFELVLGRSQHMQCELRPGVACGRAGPYLCELFENERCQPFRGWGHTWPGHFLPTDRVGHWSTRDGGPGGKASMSFRSVAPKLPPVRQISPLQAHARSTSSPQLTWLTQCCCRWSPPPMSAGPTCTPEPLFIFNVLLILRCSDRVGA